MIVVKQTVFLTYWGMVNAILAYMGQEPAEYGEMIRARHASCNTDQAVDYIIAEREGDLE